MVVQVAPTRQAATHITYEQYRALPENGKRYDVIGGELIMTAAPFTQHQRISRKLLLVMEPYVTAHDFGELFYAPIEVYLGEADFVQPDLVFVARARQAIITEKNIAGAPDLIVEILSPSTARYDRVKKANAYARHQVSHFWIVDPDAQTLEAFEWSDGAYRLVAALAEADEFQPTLFPGLTIHLAELWQ